jgi:SAM-dependent methyltransferase
MISPPSQLLHDDKAFDAQLPRYERERSRQHWTPVSVAACAARAFSAFGAKRILDVGSGPGKFCVVAGCLQPELRMYGVEQRPRLVRVGRRMARHFDAPNVQFFAGNATLQPWEEYDGFYFFNPFAESIFEDSDRFDDRVSFSTMRFGVELLRAESKLARARVGTVVVTYHGLGGAIPSTFELVSDEAAGSDRVRTWVQRRLQPATWAWFETSSAIVRVSKNHMHEALVSLICGSSNGGLFAQSQATSSRRVLPVPTGPRVSLLTPRRTLRR